VYCIKIVIVGSYGVTRYSDGKEFENTGCGGNDLRLGFYAAQWNSLGGDTMFILCGDEDHS